MVKNVHSALRQYGPLRWIRLYWDYSSYPIQSASMRIRAEFSASGVCLIDCPAEARPGAPMKKLLGEFQCKPPRPNRSYSNVPLVDLILHAWDHSIRHTYVVITGDRDIAYGLAMLRMKNYRVVLISPPNSHTDLVSQATIHLDFSQTVLGIDGGSADDKAFFPDPSSIWLPSIANFRPGYLSAQNSSRFGRNLMSVPISHSRTPPLSKSYHGDSGIDDLLSTPSRTTGLPKPGDGLTRLRSTTLEATASRSILPTSTNPPQIRVPPGLSLERRLEPLSPLEPKGKEKDLPVFESADFRSGPEARTNNSYFMTTSKAVEGAPQPHEPSYASSFPLGGMSRRSSSSSSRFSIIQNPEVSTVPTSAEKNKEDKLNNVPEASLAPVTDQLSQRSSPKSQASPSAYEKILSGSSSQAKGILEPEARIQTADPVVEQKQVAVLPLPKPILRPAPKPQAVMPKATSESKPTLATGKPSGLAMGPSSTRTKILPARWVPLINLLRLNGKKLPIETLPAKLIKSSPNAYATAGQKKYSKYIKLAEESNIVMLLEDDYGQVFVHLSEEYT